MKILLQYWTIEFNYDLLNQDKTGWQKKVGICVTVKFLFVHFVSQEFSLCELY